MNEKKPCIPLSDLQQQVAHCYACPLSEGRTQTVFGEGNPHARVLIIGEAPGKNEDLQGVPFVGAAGKSLDRLLGIAGLERSDVFIANVLKCRPPGNRDPRAEEIQACAPFLREQTRTINPGYIVTLGNFATKFILKTEVGITQLHGKLVETGRFNVFPIYHPAAAIYDRKKMTALEEDFALLGRILSDYDTFDPIAYINEPRWLESRYGLDRITELLERLGRPQDKLKFIHVAGTNGKGSVCAYTASILQHAGYRTGLFTSPYIIEFEERIRVNGRNISREDLHAVTWDVRMHADAMEKETGEHPTEFELMTAVAFEYFARSGCDIVVCEVGMGGALDSTNVIDAPEVCAITRIGLDHTDFLGSTLKEIATTKAGILKPGADVVVYPQDSAEADNAIGEVASKHGCRMSVPDFSQLAIGAVDTQGLRAFTFEGTEYHTHLLGSYQPFNAVLALTIINALRRRSGWDISDEDVIEGVKETSWPGRFEVVETERGCAAVVVDGGHNPQGARALADSLQDVFAEKRIVLIMSVLADKDYKEMIRTLVPCAAAWVCVDSPHGMRGLDKERLAQAVVQECAEIQNATAVEAPGEADTEVHTAASDDAHRCISEVHTAASFDEALQRAKALAGSDGVVCAWGSLYSLAEIKAALARQEQP